MCTLIIAHRVVACAPVVVLSNRDEFLSRPSIGPSVRRFREKKVFCCLDDQAGGTWFGINEHGLVVGLTNLTLRAPDTTLRSRGLVCMDMLACPDVSAVRVMLEGLASNAYNPFNLVALDGSSALRVTYDKSPIVQSLQPGVYATTNWPVQSEFDEKRAAAQERVKQQIHPLQSPQQVAEVLRAEGRRHDGKREPTVSVCCHANGYGTRASTLVVMDSGRGRVLVEYADGAPCEQTYVDRTAEVALMLGITRESDTAIFQ